MRLNIASGLTSFNLQCRLYVLGELITPFEVSIAHRATLDVCGVLTGVTSIAVYGNLVLGHNVRVGPTSTDGEVKLATLNIDDPSSVVSRSNCTLSSNKIVCILMMTI